MLVIFVQGTGDVFFGPLLPFFRAAETTVDVNVNVKTPLTIAATVGHFAHPAHELSFNFFLRERLTSLEWQLGHTTCSFPSHVTSRGTEFAAWIKPHYSTGPVHLP